MSDLYTNNLGYWCRDAVAAYPEKVALIDLCGATPVEITYTRLDRRMDRFASLIGALGLEPGTRMAMAIGNRFEFVEVMYGAMRAGMVPVPLNTKLGYEVLDYTVRNADCQAAVIDPACNSAIGPVIEGTGIEHRFAFGSQSEHWRDYEQALQDAAPAFTPPAINDDHPAFQPYTSGSTGRPKGVVLTHAGQLWWIRACQKYWPEEAESRSLVGVPLYHKNAMAGAIKPNLHCGGSVVILPDFEPRRFLRMLSEYRCTGAGAVPAVYTLLLQQHDLIQSLDFSALRGLSIGSAPVQEELMSAVETAFGVPVHESYGLTEGGPVMIGPPLDGRKVPFGSCGVAWPEGEIKLLDGNGEQDPHYGELWVRNPGVTPGYYHQPEVNAKKIRDGWLATGDLFSIDEHGFFYFRGRTDDMFNCGGENIYPKEVENLLLSHPAVYDASVVPMAHPIKGEVPVAMVMRAPGSGVSEAELRQYCLDNGPAYAHPRRVAVVAELPLNGAGKVDRLQVAALAREFFATEGDR